MQDESRPAAAAETRPPVSPPFRPARKDDARAVAELIEIAGEGIPTFLWSLQAASGESPLEVGTARAAREDANFSYRNAIVAERAGDVIGLLLGYRLEPAGAQEIADLSRRIPILRPLLELEQRVPGSFYINALAVRPGHRGEGLGGRLLAEAETLADEAGCAQLSVIAFAQNEGAVRLYRRHGYELRDRRPLVPHPCYPYDSEAWLLTKALRAPAIGGSSG